MSVTLQGLTVSAGALKNEKRPGLVMVQLASLLISCRGVAGLLIWIDMFLNPFRQYPQSQERGAYSQLRDGTVYGIPLGYALS